MRNTINYYYNLEPTNIHQTEDSYYFEYNNEYYKIINIEDYDVEKVYSLSNKLLNYGIYNHQIIPNKLNELITVYNEKKYVLLKMYNKMEEKITIELIRKFQQNQFQIIDNSIRNDNWSKLWESKIDYIEYQMNQFGMKYKTIRESISYYIGLTELAISLYNTYKQENHQIILAHRRIKQNQTIFEMYNPFNLIFDLKVRDQAEYLKTKLSNKISIYDETIEYLESEPLTDYELIMFFIRMLYPTFYFDEYDKIINGKDETNLKTIIENTKNYDQELKKIYMYLSLKINMPIINWLKKT